MSSSGDKYLEDISVPSRTILYGTNILKIYTLVHQNSPNMEAEGLLWTNKGANKWVLLIVKKSKQDSQSFFF